jgi:hypothetical protein
MQIKEVSGERDVKGVQAPNSSYLSENNPKINFKTVAHMGVAFC